MAASAWPCWTRAVVGTGGTGGLSTTAALNANNDLDNFSISARTRTTAFGNTSQVGFLLRFNDNEAGGYLALASFDDAAGISFRLFENASLTDVGTQIYINSNRAAAPDLALNMDYFLRVVADGSLFTFEWLNSAGTVVYTQSTNDGSLTASVGQAGIRLQASGEAVYLDDLKLGLPTIGGSPFLLSVPEPSALAIFAGAATLFGRRRRIAIRIQAFGLGSPMRAIARGVPPRKAIATEESRDTRAPWA